MASGKTAFLLEKIRTGESMSFAQQLSLALLLSLPAMIAQISTIVMEYIDASMVGHLGAEASAAIGLVATTTWLFGGLIFSFSAGFAVQVAQLIGANRMEKARSVTRQSYFSGVIFSVAITAIALAISKHLPVWLGGDPEVCALATKYFAIYMAGMPIMQISHLSSALLRASGNMVTPSILNIAMCVLDVGLNYIFIYIIGLGVTGAAIGTILSELIVGSIMFFYLATRSSELRFSLEPSERSFVTSKEYLVKAVKIGAPMGLERIILNVAQIVATIIVAPLGTFAIAANSLAVTAESLCYMPGYGVSDAATTLIGQSIGAKRQDLTKRFAWTTVCTGIIFMSLMGVLMFIFAPEMMGILSPVKEIIDLGAQVLRIESFAEPMFAASIVCYGVLVGAGDTVRGASINLLCMWGVRITLAAVLAPVYGLVGVWIAMAAELTVRGIVFLIHLARGKWMKAI